jgi:hypothetical protein
MRYRIILITALLFFTANCSAQTFNQSQLDWLTGCWSGTGLGGEVNECWVSADDGRFTGVFQMTKDGKQQFSEILMISELDGKYAYRVKHFDVSFKQWANDKGVGVVFPFVEMGDDFIQFEGLRYELIDGACHVTLDMKNDGEVHQVGFVFTKD